MQIKKIKKEYIFFLNFFNVNYIGIISILIYYISTCVIPTVLPIISKNLPQPGYV